MYVLGQYAALIKLGLSRLDKEVAKGNVTYHDVTPQLGPTAGKTHSRALQQQGTAAPNKALDLMQRRRAAVFNNQHLRADKARKTPGANPDLESLLNDPTRPGHATAQRVNAPANMARGIRAHGAGVSADSLEAIPSDASINLAAMMHEEQERKSFRKGPVHRHATHAGVEPRLVENSHLMGDVPAQDAFGKVRLENDDALVSKLMRQMGHHPDRPMPLHGRQQRALEKQLVAKSHLLSPDTLRSNFDMAELLYQQALKNTDVDYLGVDDFNKLVSKVPRAAIPAEADVLVRDLARAHYNGRNTQEYFEKLRATKDKFRQMLKR
jgi:hypothetical protein